MKKSKILRGQKVQSKNKLIEGKIRSVLYDNMVFVIWNNGKLSFENVDDLYFIK